jgi:hypothetical protein
MRKAPARSIKRRKELAASEGTDVARTPTEQTKLTAVETLPGQTCEGGSGVYIVERQPAERPGGAAASKSRGTVQEKARKAMNPLLDQVTLVVYGWKSVEPGTLSWVFPSVGAAVAAARAMKNAVRWAIVAGKRENDAESEAQDEALDEARANGSVLIEQAG